MCELDKIHIMYWRGIMSEVIELLNKQLEIHNLQFCKKPILIGRIRSNHYTFSCPR